MQIPTQTPEAKLIEELRQAVRPKLSVRRAATMAGISEGRWRQIAKGYNQVSKETFVESIAPADTLARMARVVGATPGQLQEVGREDAADELAVLYEKDREFREVKQRVGEIYDDLQSQSAFKPPALPELPRNAPNAPTLGHLDIALGAHPFRPNTFLPMSNRERQLLVSARNKLFHNRADLTDEERAVLTRFIEDDELRTLHARIDWLPRAEQLDVSARVNELQLGVEERWVADGYTNESEQLPDYARPNPLPREGTFPDPDLFPPLTPVFATKEKKDDLETASESATSPEGNEGQEDELTQGLLDLAARTVDDEDKPS